MRALCPVVTDIKGIGHLLLKILVLPSKSDSYHTKWICWHYRQAKIVCQALLLHHIWCSENAHPFWHWLHSDIEPVCF